MGAEAIVVPIEPGTRSDGTMFLKLIAHNEIKEMYERDHYSSRT